MNTIINKSYLFQGFMGACIINMVLFCSLPGLIIINKEKNDLENLSVINFTRLKPEILKPKPKEKLQKEKPKSIQKKIYKVHRQRQKTVAKKQLKLDMPAMDLAIDPRITGGIPVVSPPTEEVIADTAVEAGLNFDGIMDQTQVDTIPLPTFKRNPRYPYRAKRMGLEGKVKITFLVDKEGNVSDITIIDADPPEIFNESVLNAVSAWEYAPGELMGRKVTTLVTTSILFKLEAGQ